MRCWWQSRAAIVVFVTSLVTACAPQSHVRPDTVPSKDHVKNGRVIVSLTHQSSNIGIHGAELRIVKEGSTGPNHGISYSSRGVRGNPDTHRVTIEEGAILGEVVFIELPPGRYVVDHWSIALSQYVDFFGNVELTSEKFQPLKLFFHVEPGKVTYIGNIHLNVRSRNSAGHELKDMGARDLGLLTKKHSGINVASVENRLMSKQE